jgi:hypothetical protein
MSKPSLTDFMTPAPAATAPAAQPLKPAKQGEEIKNLTVRMTRSQWEHVVALTTTERLKIQPYIIKLIEDDFERRGLRF